MTVEPTTRKSRVSSLSESERIALLHVTLTAKDARIADCTLVSRTVGPWQEAL